MEIIDKKVAMVPVWCLLKGRLFQTGLGIESKEKECLHRHSKGAVQDVSVCHMQSWGFPAALRSARKQQPLLFLILAAPLLDSNCSFPTLSKAHIRLGDCTDSTSTTTLLWLLTAGL